MAEKHWVSYVSGIILSLHHRLTQHPYERLWFFLCIIFIRKLRRKVFSLPGLTLLRRPRTRSEPRCSGARPIPFCLSQFLFEDCPLPDRFSRSSVTRSCLICQLLQPVLHWNVPPSELGFPPIGKCQIYPIFIPRCGPHPAAVNLLACHLRII